MFLTEVLMYCGLGNAAVAWAIAISALLFGAWMARVLMSSRLLSRKAPLLAVLLVSSIVGSGFLQTLAIWTQASMAAFTIPGEVGCIGERAPALLGPAATLVSALVFSSAGWLWRRVRSPRTS